MDYTKYTKSHFLIHHDKRYVYEFIATLDFKEFYENHSHLYVGTKQEFLNNLLEDMTGELKKAGVSKIVRLVDMDTALTMIDIEKDDVPNTVFVSIKLDGRNNFNRFKIMHPELYNYYLESSRILYEEDE